MRTLVLSLLTLSQITFASTEVITKIFNVESNENKANVLSIADGKVYSVETAKSDIVSALKMASHVSAVVKLSIANDGESIDSFEVVENAKGASFSAFASNLEKNAMVNARERRLSDYVPSTLRSNEKAQELFDSVFQYKEEDGYDLNDNCFNRAHYWARTMFIQDKVKSQKVFIFFTEKYRRDNNYKWWYHVAPFVLVGSSKKEVVLDMSFEAEPITMKEWEKDFASHAKKSCYNGKSLSDYYAKTNTEDCVLVRASMYHYTPTDLEDNGSITDWTCSSLRSVMRSIPGPERKGWDKVEGFLDGCR